jgi:hypothetical protein
MFLIDGQFGQLESAGDLVVLSTSGGLEVDNGNGFQQLATGVHWFSVNPKTGAIVYG